jgi:hypothetical protein
MYWSDYSCFDGPLRGPGKVPFARINVPATIKSATCPVLIAIYRRAHADRDATSGANRR